MTHSHQPRLKQMPKPHKGKPKSHKKRKASTIGSRPAEPRTSNRLSFKRVAIVKKGRVDAAKALKSKRHSEAIAKRRSGAMSEETVPPKVVLLVPFKAGVQVTAFKNALASLSETMVLRGSESRQQQEGQVRETSVRTQKDTFQTPLAASESDVGMTAPAAEGLVEEPHHSPMCIPLTFQLPAYAQMSLPGEGKRQRLTLVDASAHAFSPPACLPDLNQSKNTKKQVLMSDGTENTQPSIQYITKQGLQTVLDLAKTSNVILCVFQGVCSLQDPPYDELGYALLSALRLQGLPTPIGVMIGDSEYEALNAGQRRDQRKLVQRYFASEFGDDAKFITCAEDPQNDMKALLRLLSSASPKEFSWRNVRGYMLPDRSALIRSHEDQAVEGRYKLVVEGYARGLGITVKHPLHITGIGDVILEKIIAIEDPLKPRRERRKLDTSEEWVQEFEFSDRILEELTPDVELKLKEEWGGDALLRPYDPLAGDQTWPTKEELDAADRNSTAKEALSRRNRSKKICLPEGSFDSSGHDHTDDTRRHDQHILDEDNDMEYLGDDEPSHNPQAEAASSQIGDAIDTELDEEEEEEEGSEVPQHTHDEMAMEKKRLRFEFEDRSLEDLEFPDEVDTPTDLLARDRFRRYRGLKSFKSSPWDPYEDLPNEYSRIYEFDAFRATSNFAKHQFLQDCFAVCESRPVTGLYVRLEIRLFDGCPMEKMKLDLIRERLAAMDRFLQSVTGSCPTSPFVISSLLPYERKPTVTHFHLTRQSGCQESIPSKALVELQCGFKRFPARPIYSSATKTPAQRNCAKSKFERFFHPGTSVVASIYSPASFPPAPVLMFRSPDYPSQEELESNSTIEYTAKEELQQMTKLTAWGHLLEADSRRVIVKRVVLTGYPFRVHKKKAVVRFMFFNPEDIRWFRPVDLITKMGLRGRIKESLGTHGYMKCIFNDHMTQSDTVCMYLYKRVYPTWYPPTWGGLEEQTAIE